MARRWKVWQASNAFHYAGTDRAVAAWCLDLDPRRWELSAYSRLFDGPRRLALTKAKRRAKVLGPDPAAWSAELKRNPCDLLHIHRHGEADAGWDSVIQAARAAGVKRIVQTNIFGAEDKRGLGPSLDHHFYVSAMCLWRFAGWPEALPSGFLQRHSVLYNPLRLSELPKAPVSAEQRARARKALGLPGDAFVLGRLGRPDRNKWPAWLPGAFAGLLQQVPRARLLLMEAPEGVEAELERLGVRDRACLLPASADWAPVRQAYEAMDVLAHGSRVGESFGYTLAEAQAFGLAVLCDTTPWADNAQVELIEHGVDGMLAGRPEAYVAALARLAGDPALRQRLGRTAFHRARERYDSKRLAQGLARTYEALLNGQPLIEDPQTLAFGGRYAPRLQAREDPRVWDDGLWALRSTLRLYGRGWASRALKFWRWGR